MTILEEIRRNEMPLPPHNAQFVDVVRHWRKIKKIIDRPESRTFLLPDLLQYQARRQLDCWESQGYLFKDRLHPTTLLPKDFDHCDWRLGKKRFAYHRYVCHSACYWMVNFNLYLAQRYDPKQPWRILVNDSPDQEDGGHATVWGGNLKKPLLFDMQGLALFESATQVWDVVRYGIEYPIGESFITNNWVAEVRRLTALGAPIR